MEIHDEGVVARFWAKVEVLEGGECWPWKGSIQSNGYGSFYLGRIDGRKTNTTAHRVSFEIRHGVALPKGRGGLCIDHLCSNRRCVNPAHLDLVTWRENCVRGEGFARKARQTHCKRGHLLAGVNLDAAFLARTGRRCCRVCSTLRPSRSRSATDCAVQSVASRGGSSC